jgi:hopanoid biosynthesis associated RND transporter like protein HpnN
MTALLDLMKDPDTSPNTIEILAPSLTAASDLARKLASLPEVDKTMTLESFVPDGQPEKRALIEDAALVMDTALNPFEVKPPPSMEEILASVVATRDAVGKAAGEATTPAAQAARRFGAALDGLAKADAAMLSRATAAMVPGLQTVLAQLRDALSPQTADLGALPEILKRDWVTPDGRARVQVFAKGDSNNKDTLQTFATAVRAVAPGAIGAPVTTLESGRTIVNAFIEAGLLSLVAMILLLAFALRNLHDVVVTLGPLLAASVLTFATCVVIGLPLNFANIIVLPLLFGIGVAFHIYFIMAWREGTREFLQTSLTRAVFLSALATASGFGTLWLSSHPGTSSMGELLMISLWWTLVTLFVLPTVLEAARGR